MPSGTIPTGGTRTIREESMCMIASTFRSRKWDRTFRYPTAEEKRAARRRAQPRAQRAHRKRWANVRSTPAIPCRGWPVVRLLTGPACVRTRLAAISGGRLPMAHPPRAHGAALHPQRRAGSRGNRRMRDWGGANDGGRGLSGKSGELTLRDPADRTLQTRYRHSPVGARHGSGLLRSARPRRWIRSQPIRARRTRSLPRAWAWAWASKG